MHLKFTEPLFKTSLNQINQLSKIRSCGLNETAQWIFDKLFWPKKALFIFSTEDDAITCINMIFPKSDYGTTEFGKMRIKIVIVSDAENNAGLISERFLNKGIDDLFWISTG